MTKAFQDRIILVTGASRGIGYACAKALAAQGAHIIATARTQGGLEDLDDVIKNGGGTCTLVPMDIKDYDAIDRLGAALQERFGRLDGLLANAGILGDISPMPHITPKTWDNVMAVNATANYRLIRSMDPLLRASTAGRAVFLSSSVAQTPRAYWGCYGAAKAAMETFVSAYAQETSVTNLKVNILNPGAVRTAMRAKAMPGEDPTTLPAPENIAPLVLDMLAPTYDKTDEIITFRETAYFSE
ncbi:MAG: SDR family NAD(P)-dependent oxidoreductase [Litorimonas sp.]